MGRLPTPVQSTTNVRTPTSAAASDRRNEHRTNPRRATRNLVLDDMGREDAPKLVPAPAIEPAVGRETLRRRIGHEEGVVRVVVGEQTLAPKGQYVAKAVE